MRKRAGQRKKQRHPLFNWFIFIPCQDLLKKICGHLQALQTRLSAVLHKELPFECSNQQKRISNIKLDRSRSKKTTQSTPQRQECHRSNAVKHRTWHWCLEPISWTCTQNSNAWKHHDHSFLKIMQDKCKSHAKDIQQTTKICRHKNQEGKSPSLKLLIIGLAGWTCMLIITKWTSRNANKGYQSQWLINN